jgi:hypothetical protein
MRPLGVTFSACFEFVRAALISLVGLAVMLVVASRLAAVAAEGNTLQRALAGFGKFVGIAMLVYAAIQLALGLGLLMRQNWARLLTMIFCGLGVLILLPRLIHLRPMSLLFGLLQLAVLIYLALSETRCYFEQKESRAPNPA